MGKIDVPYKKIEVVMFKHVKQNIPFFGLKPSLLLQYITHEYIQYVYLVDYILMNMQKI